MKSNRIRILFVALLLSTLTSEPALAQYEDLVTVDFGRNYLSLPTANISLLFYASPTKDKKPIWRVDAGSFQDGINTFVNRISLTNLNDASMQDAWNRLFEVYPVDEYAMPVLSFSSDSLWVKVSLNCRIKENPPSGWLYVYDAYAVHAKVKSWTSFFYAGEYVMFISDSMMTFYSDRGSKQEVSPKLTRNSDGIDYCMKVLQTSGEWMQVSLESPSPFAQEAEGGRSSNDPKVLHPELWIQFLDADGRPRIWYHRH